MGNHRKRKNINLLWEEKVWHVGSSFTVLKKISITWFAMNQQTEFISAHLSERMMASFSWLIQGPFSSIRCLCNVRFMVQQLSKVTLFMAKSNLPIQPLLPGITFILISNYKLIFIVMYDELSVITE